MGAGLGQPIPVRIRAATLATGQPATVVPEARVIRVTIIMAIFAVVLRQTVAFRVERSTRAAAPAHPTPTPVMERAPPIPAIQIAAAVERAATMTTHAAAVRPIRVTSATYVMVHSQIRGRRAVFQPTTRTSSNRRYGIAE